MNIIHLNSPKLIVGIGIRTNNSDELSGKGKIQKLWEKFYQDNLHEKIKNKTSENIYGIYSDYESDHNGEYHYFIGFEVLETQAYEKDPYLAIKKIDLGKYSAIATEKGVAQQVIPMAWNKIWKMNSSELGGKRSFQTDFEIYPQEANASNLTIFNIYLGIK